MNKISKSDLEELFIKKFNLTNKESASLENLVNELYDQNKKTVLPLTELETFVFRKRYGITNNGIPIPKEAISKDYNIGYQKVQKLLNSSLTKFLYRINILDRRVKEKRFSTFYLKRNEDSIIDYTNLNQDTIKLLKKENILTLSDLLELGRIEIKDIVGEKRALDIISYIHSLGYRFIDELTINEKKNIISKYSKEVIDNTSIYFLDSVKKIDYDTLKNINAKTIKDFIIKKELLPKKSKMLVAKEIIDMGYEIPRTDYRSQEELLDLDIAILQLNKSTYELLKGNQINKVRDLVVLRKDDISILPFLTIRKVNEIINKVHQIGLLFSDEVQKLSDYAENIREQLKTSK